MAAPSDRDARRARRSSVGALLRAGRWRGATAALRLLDQPRDVEAVVDRDDLATRGETAVYSQVYPRRRGCRARRAIPGRA